MIPSERLDAFKATLRRTDWTYIYADGAAYYRGQESYFKACHEKAALMAEFPDDAPEIQQLWEDYGG